MSKLQGGIRGRLALSFCVVLASALALTIACSDGSITGPELAVPRKGSANVSLQTRIVYLGAPRSAPINYIRAAVYDTITGERLAFIDQTLDPAKNSFDFYFPVPLPLGSAIPAKLTIELANRTATSEVVEYSGRRTDLVLKSGDFKQVEIDIYPGPLSNFDVTGVAIAKPMAERIEGDSVQATAKITGKAGDARVSWTSLDDSIASVGADGVVHAVLPGVARIVAAVGEHSDTAAMTILVKRAGIVVSPAEIDVAQAGDTANFSATVVDPRGNPIAGDSAVWSISDTSLASPVSPGSYVLRHVGKSVITATAKRAPQLSASASIAAKSAGSVSISKSTITAAPSSVTADGISTTAVTVRLTDANGNPAPNATVLLSNSGTGVLSAVTDNRDGSYSASLTAPTAVGSALISATIGANAIGPAAVAFVAGPAARYVVSVTAASTASDAPRTVSVRLTDANGNAVALSGRVVTWTDSGTGGTFSSGTSLTDSTGSASVTFSPGAGTNVSHSITATDNGAPAATGTSAPFVTTVTVQGSSTVPVSLPASKLRIATSAAGAASGAAFTTQPVIEISDSTGTRMSADSSSVVTMTVSSGASVVGAVSATAKSGIATFATAGISGVAGTAYTLTFASPSLSPVAQGISTTVGAASQLAITTSAAGATSGAAFTTQPVVTIRDAAGNTRTSDNSTTVTMTVSAGATIIGSASVTAVNGVATFTSVGLSGTDGAAYTLTFSSGGLTAATQTATVSAARTVIGAATSLAVSTAPAGAASGAAFSTQPVIAIRDVNGNTVTSDNSSVVTMTVSGDGSVVGTATATAVNGAATFGNVGISGASGVAYTLTFSVTGLTSVTQSITPTAGAASQLSITRSAAGASSGAAFSTQPIVEVRDAFGNTRVADNATVITMSASSGATVVGTADKTASSGAANYSGVGISGTAGTSYTLTFSSAGLTAATQSITPVAGAATQLALTTSASGAPSGAAFLTQPVVTLRDGAGNTATSNSTAVVTMTVSTGGTVVGTATATASSGVATFATVGITGTTGVAYTLTFSSSGLTSATQSITASASQGSLAVTTSAAGAGSGAAFGTQPVIAVRDGNGSTATTDNSTVVTMTVSSGATVVGTATATASSGVATFSNVGMSGAAGTAYTLTFSATGLSSATQSITPTAGAASKLVGTTSASGSASGAAFSTQPVVVIRDAFGNTLTGDNATVVTMTVSSGGTVIGTATATAANGVATFVTVGISGTAGTAYTLTFSASGVTSATQSITPTAGALDHFSITATDGTAVGTQTVNVAGAVKISARDAAENVVTSFASTVSLTASGATLSGSPVTTASFASGVLASQSLTFTSTGTSVTITATGSSKTGTSATFSVTNQTLSMATQPSGAASGSVMTTVPAIQLKDNGVNQSLAGVAVSASVATQPSSGASLAISGGAASATTNSSGIATFTNLVLSGSTGAYTLRFTATGYSSVVSNSLTLTAGLATQIVMSGPDTIVSQAVSEPITITLKDGAGNTTTAGAGGVTIVMSTDGTGTFYSDQAGTTALPSNQISIAAGSSTATVYYQDTQVLSSPVTRTITAAKVGGGLASGTFHLYTKSASTASQRLVCKTRGNPNNSSSFVDITGCSAIASTHRLLIGVSVAGTVTISADSSGWTLVSSAQAVGNGSEKLTMAVFQKTATSSDNGTSSYRFHWTGSGSTNLKNVASLVVYKNATVDVSTTKSSSTGGTTASTNPATPSTTSTTAVYWFGLSSGESNADIITNWTISKDLYTETLAAGNSNSASILAADIDRQTQSTYQSRSAANAALSSSSAWIGMVTVLK